MSTHCALSEPEKIEVALLLEAIFLCYGYDFRGYARSCVERRLQQFCVDSGGLSYLDLTAQLIRSEDVFSKLLPYFSVSVTSLFRAPHLYQAMRREVIPLLRTWPHIKLWDAGCATGEEVYSLAILLQEEGVLERTTIYATDINQADLDKAQAGIYDLNIIRKGAANYYATHGRSTLSSYYHARYNAAVMHSSLRKRVTFARHNLAMDESFGQMQAIICRNVLIYFNQDLQNRVLELFWESLDRGGFLCLGDNESLNFSSVADRFESVSDSARIYKKKAVK